MFSTRRLSEEDPALLTCQAQVLDVIDEQGTTVVILDQTVFRPGSDEKGSDVGLIESEDKRFHVRRVEQLEDRIRHIGIFEGEPFQADETVTCVVNEEFRRELEENKPDAL